MIFVDYICIVLAKMLDRILYSKGVRVSLGHYEYIILMKVDNLTHNVVELIGSFLGLTLRHN